MLGRGGRRTSISERARSRILTDDELRRVWSDGRAGQGRVRRLRAFLLCTATRRGEAAALQRSELSDGGQTWIIPARKYKSGRDTLIPLSAAARAIVAAQPMLGDYVFSADGSRPLGGFDARKKDFDKRSGVSGYGLHDLRRTAERCCSRAGISADIAEMCLGHALTGVRGTYDRHAYEREKREAFEALSMQIQRIVRPPPEAEVADIASERSKRRGPS